jgi:hypothetical protein
MSDLRIALIAEGLTDQVIIEAALQAIIQRPFVLTLLQPEATQPQMGSGWGGVLKWCQQFHKRGYPSFEDDVTLAIYDLFIIHLDADVAEKQYANISPDIEQQAHNCGWGDLPCSQPCPPPEPTVANLTTVLVSWLGNPAVGKRTVFCIPSKSSEVWLAMAVFPDNQKLLQDLECTLDIETRLVILPKAKRIRKSQREYRRHAATITTHWIGIRQRCSQAAVFHDQITQALTP